MPADSARRAIQAQVARSNAGPIGGQTSQSRQAFADSIEATTTVSQGAVMQNLALLASMTNLDEQGLKKAQSPAIELSAAYNIDLQSATQLVAKAANGQTVGLQKLGVQFTKTGNDASTYANALQAIEKFSGTAASKTNTFEGQMLVMQNATQKLLESFGNLIVQNPLLISGLQGFTNLIVRAAGWVDSFSKFIQNNVEWLEPLAFGLGAC